MKTLKCLVIAQLRPILSLSMGSLHFAYQPCIEVDLAGIFSLHRGLSQLKKTGSTVRITFFDFSIWFVRFRVRCGYKLDCCCLALGSCILQLVPQERRQDYLTKVPQYVRTRICVSESSTV